MAHHLPWGSADSHRHMCTPDTQRHTQAVHLCLAPNAQPGCLHGSHVCFRVAHVAGGPAWLGVCEGRRAHGRGCLCGLLWVSVSARGLVSVVCVCTCTRERCSMWVWVHTCVSGCCVCVSPPAPRPSGHDCSAVCGETCVSTAAHTGNLCTCVWLCVCLCGRISNSWQPVGWADG